VTTRESSRLERFIRWVMRDTRYHALYPCTVESQASDGSLDLTPDDESIRGTGLQAVPIRHGLPGVRVKVKQGARLLVGFEAGDPSRPFASFWEPGAIEEISVDGGDQPVSRKGDPVTVFWPPSVAVTGTTPVGAFVGTMTITSAASGLIDDGAANFKA
jgi:hypothetical protein